MMTWMNPHHATTRPRRPDDHMEGAKREDRSVGELVKRLACSSASCCVADAMCLPMDMIKVRLQLQNELVASSAPRLGPIGMGRAMLRKEGPGSFWVGIGPAMARQASYGGLSFFSYPMIRDELYHVSGTTESFGMQLLAGALAGGSASAVANPTDVVKVRMQADGRRVLENKPRLYPNSGLAVLSGVLKNEGFFALYAGLGPNVSRAAVVNGVGIAAYDVTKSIAHRVVGDDRPLAHRFVGALVGGLATAAAGCPFDVLKTRLMARDKANQLYSSAFHCLVATVQTEGPLALWKGFLPVYCRQAPFNLLNYLILESLLDLAVRSN